MASSTASGGVGFFGLLTIVFIALKLMGYITWSWLWVLSPLWLSFVVGLVLVLIFAIITGIAENVSKK